MLNGHVQGLLCNQLVWVLLEFVCSKNPTGDKEERTIQSSVCISVKISCKKTTIQEPFLGARVAKESRA